MRSGKGDDATGGDNRVTDVSGRRGFLRTGIGLAAAGAGALWLPGCASMASGAMAEAGADPHTWVRPQRELAELAAHDIVNGGADPFPIPWLDKNGSHNQSPGPEMEPSSIFHFKGHVARANDFTGMGTTGDGRRLAFGSKSTDFSFMQGEYFAGRDARTGTFAHI